MMKAKPSDFMGWRRKLSLPSLFVSKGSKTPAAAKSKRKVAFNVDSLDKAVDAFDESERSLRQRR